MIVTNKTYLFNASLPCYHSVFKASYNICCLSLTKFINLNSLVIAVLFYSVLKLGQFGVLSLRYASQVTV